MKKLMGVVSLLLGVGLGTWIAYNYLVEMQPEARGRNPIVPILLTIGLLYQGQKWWREG